MAYRNKEDFNTYVREYQREYRRRNPQKMSEQRRRKYEHDRTRPDYTAKQTAYMRKWRSENPFRVRARSSSTEVRGWVEILSADPCSYCGASQQHFDHIEPVAQGGEHTWENLTSSCARCNQQKKDKTLLEFLLWQRR